MARPKRVPVPDEPPIMLFPTKGGKLWGLTRAQLNAWQRNYNFDVAADCRRAANWCEVWPARRKQFHTMPRFLVNWLNRTAATTLVKTPVPHGQPWAKPAERTDYESMRDTARRRETSQDAFRLRRGQLRYDGWTCPHVEPCHNRTTCELRTEQGRPQKQGASAP